MTEHRPDSAQQSPDHVEVLRCVTLLAIPVVYGLDDPDDGVLSWVFALPGGEALIVPSQGRATGLVHTTLDQVVHWWAPFRGGELVLVTGA
jgi:hypothetical protein